MKKLLTILTLITVSLIGCKKQEDICLPVSSDFLQGNWSDYCNNCGAFGASLYYFYFKDDSFKMNHQRITDVWFAECGAISNWAIYGKGLVEYKNGILSLTGVYCDENYDVLLESPCEYFIDTGKFYMEFNNVYYCNDTLVLQNTSLNDWQGLIKLKRE